MPLLFRRKPHAAAIARDADRMLRQYGPEADRVVGEMAWREDAGLLTAPSDGHWHRVHLEIGRRVGRSLPTFEDSLVADAAPLRPKAGDFAASKPAGLGKERPAPHPVSTPS